MSKIRWGIRNCTQKAPDTFQQHSHYMVLFKPHPLQSGSYNASAKLAYGKTWRNIVQIRQMLSLWSVQTTSLVNVHGSLLSSNGRSLIWPSHRNFKYFCEWEPRGTHPWDWANLLPELLPSLFSQTSSWNGGQTQTDSSLRIDHWSPQTIWLWYKEELTDLAICVICDRAPGSAIMTGFPGNLAIMTGFPGNLSSNGVATSSSLCPDTVSRTHGSCDILAQFSAK